MLLAATPWLPALLPFLVASGVTVATVPATMTLARRAGGLDHPDDEGDRRIHTEPTPRLGGLALWAGFAVAVAVLGGSIGQRWQIVAATGVITVLMAIDDTLKLGWWTSSSSRS